MDFEITPEQQELVDSIRSVSDQACPTALARDIVENGSTPEPGCEEPIQIHGGMGYTWESDVQLFVKRAKTVEALFGTGEAHRQRIADLLEA